jgi:hypothetical protein
MNPVGVNQYRITIGTCVKTGYPHLMAGGAKILIYRLKILI